MRLDFCVACGRRDSLDDQHLVPKSRGGSNDESNLITLCRACHGLLHGVRWSLNQAKLIKRGLAATRRRGIKWGRKSYAEAMPETVALAKALRAEGLSLRKIGAALAGRGHLTSGGKQHDAMAVRKMLGSA